VAIRDAWLQHKVIFFRNQDHLDDEAQANLAWIFGGAAMAHPTVPPAAGTAFTYEVDSAVGAAARWHTDLSWYEVLPRGAILRSVSIPPVGGDTMWANTAAAYQDLPPRLRARADESWALHTNGSDRTSDRTDGQTDERRAFFSAFRSTIFRTHHPLAHVHPETGEPCLLLGQFFVRLLESTVAESKRVFARYQRYITRPENTVRWHWAVGDVAVWDNRATQHYALADYGDAKRMMRRVSMDGEPTVNAHGQRSRTVIRESSPQDRALAP
jgi:taurine dioxygenase